MLEHQQEKKKSLHFLLNVHHYILLLLSCPSVVIKGACQPIHIHANPAGRLKWPYAITRPTAHSASMCGLMSDWVICKFRKCMITHDTECTYWDQVSLNNTNQPTNRFHSACSQRPPFKVIIRYHGNMTIMNLSHSFIVMWSTWP